MHYELKISPDRTVYYRYNPQADVLAVRFEPRFEPGNEEALDEMPEVSLTRDPASGDYVGMRITSVQQLILSALVRDMFTRLRPMLEEQGGAVPPAIAPASDAPIATKPDGDEGQEDAADAASSPAPASSPGEGAAPEASAEAPAPSDKPKRKRRRRRRRKPRSSEDRSDSASGLTEMGPSATGSSATGESQTPRSATDEVPPEDKGPDRASTVAAAPLFDEASAEASDPEPPALPEPTAASPVEPQQEAAVSPEEAPAGDPAVESPDELDSADLQAGQPDDLESSQPDLGVSDIAADSAPLSPTEAPSAPAASNQEPSLSSGPEQPSAFSELGLHPSIGRAIADLGFETPTPIQLQGVPVALEGRDVVGLAQTGTGKTLAFVAPGLHRMLAEPADKHVPRMLILAPTRELTVQVAEEAERLAKHSGLRVTTVYGGVSMGQQISDLKRGVDLIVATPGRMLDHLRRGNVKIGTVQMLVLDEADRMLDMGFLPDVRSIMAFLGPNRQTLFFTATMPPEIESLSLEFQTDPATVEIARRKPPEAIDQRIYPVGKHLKAPLLVHLLGDMESMQRVLIFTERKIDADVLARKLVQAGVKVALMHGDRRQRDRERALADLAEGKVQVLVATNVAARGLDIDDISHVVNYDMPQTVDEYVHRIGRTARAEAGGSAWSFVTVSDEIIISRIESALERTIPRVQSEDFDYDVPTPSWAKPSAKDVLAMLNKKQSRSDRMRNMGRRR